MLPVVLEDIVYQYKHQLEFRASLDLIKGMKKVLKNLNKEIVNIHGKTRQGVLAAVTFIEGESNEIVPHDKGILINSSFSGVRKRFILFGKIIGRVGYTAKYAPFVHEMPESNNFTKPDTGPKFLEKAVKNHMAKILEIIRNRAKIQ